MGELTKMFPIQSDRRAAPHPLKIPWAVAELAYSTYVAQFGRCQRLERLAERGGFSAGEMDMFLPDWRARCDAMSQMAAKIADLERQLADAMKYGAPENATRLPYVKAKNCHHNDYWTTVSGACMACRAVEAEQKLTDLHKLRRLLGLRDDADVGAMMNAVDRLHTRLNGMEKAVEDARAESARLKKENDMLWESRAANAALEAARRNK